jgi:predicted transcriptional regulator
MGGVAIATPRFSDSTSSMGKANKALKQVLSTYSISQSRLTLASGIDRSTLLMWLHEQEEPASENIVEIVKALKQINPDAAQQFIQLYLS